ncbi:MAG: hypothetical protein K2H52_11375 [Lachnospiraceae bacterium]|nr:hypothetical protein [Lachnospiraceae bacterium]
MASVRGKSFSLRNLPHFPYHKSVSDGHGRKLVKKAVRWQNHQGSLWFFVQFSHFPCPVTRVIITDHRRRRKVLGKPAGIFIVPLQDGGKFEVRCRSV